jgi:hypothetical protein
MALYTSGFLNQRRVPPVMAAIYGLENPPVSSLQIDEINSCAVWGCSAPPDTLPAYCYFSLPTTASFG